MIKINSKLSSFSVILFPIFPICQPRKKTFHYRFFVRSVIGGGYTYQQAIKGCAEKKWFLAPIFDLRQNEALLRMFRENDKLTEGSFKTQEIFVSLIFLQKLNLN